MSLEQRFDEPRDKDTANKREGRRGSQVEDRFDFVLRMIALVAISWLVCFAYLQL
jgi:hypothetical protein